MGIVFFFYLSSLPTMMRRRPCRVHRARRREQHQVETSGE
jgi:hypothetical protein